MPFRNTKKNFSSDRDSFNKRKKDDGKTSRNTSFKKRRDDDETDRNPEFRRRSSGKSDLTSPKPIVVKKKSSSLLGPALIRLNRYIANSGVCSRREADKLISSGAVMVNGKVVTELGTKVSATDKIQLGDDTLRIERKYYVLLNKPRDYITTSSDPQNRKTVMSLISSACDERIYPVGRLDRNTTGLLLFTNDGDIARKLMHPSSKIKKLYHVELDRKLQFDDLKKIEKGVQIEDAYVKVDHIEFVEGVNDQKQIGIELHSGQNRIVRRIFESMDYKVVKLDRVMYAGLTKRDVPRGKWRHLKPIEVNFLKML